MSQLETTKQGAVGDEEVNGGDVVAAIARDSERWARVLAVRDRFRGRGRVLLVGRDLSALAILLAREGSSVHALDGAPEADFQKAREAFLSDDASGSLDGAYERLHGEVLADALTGGPFNAVYLTDGYGLDLRTRLQQIIPAVQTSGAVVQLDIPFGLQAPGDGASVFPRDVVVAFDGFAIESFEISEGRVVATLVPGDPGIGPDSEWLLERTEAGARQRIELVERHLSALSSELVDLREDAETNRLKLREMHESTSFRVGLAFAQAMRSPRALFRLPVTLLEIVRNRSSRTRFEHATAKQAVLSEWEKETLRARARAVLDQGPDAVIASVDEAIPDTVDSARAFAYLVAAQACGVAGRRDVEFAVASRALDINPSAGMMRGFLHVALRCREMQAASDVLAKLHAAAREGNGIAKRFIRQLEQTSSYKIAVLEAIAERPELWRHAGTGRLCYVLHNTLPYSSGGYATRSHGVAMGLRKLGREAVCVSRPGYPLDIKTGLAPVDVPPVDVIDGVPYQRISEPARQGQPEYKYVLAAADRLEAELKRLDPAYVMAASNYVTGLPALVAARRLGIPFIYEVRGLWEITRMSRDQAFGESISFDVQRHIEGTLAKSADYVFTLTQAMADELVARGVDRERIGLLPNSVDASRFLPSPRDTTLAASLDIPDDVPVIGYVGTFVVYEGLEHLVEACVTLHRRGLDFRLMLVGNENASGEERGPITEEILRIARKAGIESKLILTGRVPHEQVESYYSLIDICPFPRKPWPVCEMVSPMKPLEALALEKAVVVSSVRALAEMVQDGVTGVVFEKGNVDSLADAIEALAKDPARRIALGRAGRDWVVRERAWSQIAERIEAVLTTFEAQRAPPEASEATSATGSTSAE